ncbi:MFS transporter [Streptomyces clavuligerus]|uniref:Putative proline/betaine transporter n=1 Tax=Streptomyces clavuligerus TaxID=1901 RepID=E2Q1H3_STRCL|nr:MFS transporter [Streptomyces clavuligerus]ANW16880.1 MFS transporter [Streptomyces clavuligerus]AXU11409.1 MFS transporter [Streptomyces clavuligerus]EFG10599.1 major facilitator superfamily permease [Streptomyces clavuligerus]MBY6301225.1 MHS family MFS transporter [Streptomyces clavuligerus]QCS04280.1 MFS transporter [Streptomyces clavuligerus]
MTDDARTTAAPDGRQTSGGITRIVGASLIGATIEWYDFFLYGTAAALVFNTVFFPTDDPLVGTLIAFVTYAIGFAARPLGGLVFGHYGDRIGRKKLLVLSLLLMGGSTFAMGLLPTYDSIGVAAPILLTVLRLVQGFALGGEWGGAVLIVSEHGGDRHRGFWASWPQAGVPCGNLLATGVLALLASVQSDAAFQSWGWRVPFLLSGVLVAIGLWIRVSVSESPVFLEARAKAEAAAARGVKRQAPVVEVFRRNRREVLGAMGVRFGENVSYYILTSFLLVYVTNHLDLPKSTALNAVLIASALHFLTIPLWGALSDRWGRRPVTLIGSVGMAGWAFAFFTLVDTGSFLVITLAVTVGLLFHGAMLGPQAAFISEMFDTEIRYSGASMGSQLATIVAGALAPIIAVELLKDYDSAGPVALYLSAAAIVTTLTTVVVRETRGRDLSRPAAPEPAPVPARAGAGDASAGPVREARGAGTDPK